MKTSAKIIADSKNEFGNRITTMQVTFPRFILAELNTHRMFSKNSASSRAIPFEKMVKSVEENPFIPIAWQKDHKGMQGSKYLDTLNSHIAKEHWLKARDNAILEATLMNRYQVTKQLCNRLLEPFMWHTVLITATEWENFFYLRCPHYRTAHGLFRSKKDAIKASGLKEKEVLRESVVDWLLINEGQAEIHAMALAEAIWDAYNESEPKELKAGEWHIPFGDVIRNQIHIGNDGLNEETLKTENLVVKVATAMCARVSYTVVGEESKEPNYENDIKLHDRLAESGHWSPFEHCARAMSKEDYYTNVNGFVPFIQQLDNKGNVLLNGTFTNDKHLGWSGNFKGFIQYRKMFNNENKN